MDYVYKLDLNLNFFMDKLRSEFKNSELYELDDNPKFLQTNVSRFFNCDSIHLKGIDWEHAAYFQKINGYTGSIHVDYRTGFWPAINIICSGHTTMEYWHEETVVDAEIYTYGDVGDAFRLKAFKTDKAPDKIYQMPIGVYLINASVPHRATGHGGRRLISLRSMSNLEKTWSQMTELFQDIIDEPSTK